ncbi:hypothetical protein [Acetobacter lambici]|uniref:DUF3551 domain-containing protein n=1 Tax=Acetobacter lambici TaxID=1332824 RepID=A0ABT1F3Y0_9PROT|nr:hypothetical protein [Acetobacter lambici]MCP1242318.1 hypothetical protein [Acetobacter lambici]MCP1258434.1 hypothetical protein [Acetobacter lambici]
MSCLNRHFARTARLVLSALVLGAGVWGAAGLPAWADTARDQQTRACKGDALRLCALAIPNEKKIAACMARKKDKLSPACSVYFKDTPTPAGTTKATKQTRTAKH